MSYNNQRKVPGQNSNGQIAVEYVLLLILTVAISALMVRALVSRNPDSPGFIVTRWALMIHTIGSDYPTD